MYKSYTGAHHLKCDTKVLHKSTPAVIICPTSYTRKIKIMINPIKLPIYLDEINYTITDDEKQFCTSNWRQSLILDIDF